MSDSPKTYNLNSSLIRKVAGRCGMSVPEFVEFSVLSILYTLKEEQGQILMADGSVPAETFSKLHQAIQLMETVKNLPPFERKKIEQLPSFNRLNLKNLEE